MNLREMIELGINGDKNASEMYYKTFRNLIKKNARILNYEEAETDLTIFLLENMYKLASILPIDADDPLVIYYVAKKMKYKRIDLYRKYMVKSIEMIPTEMIEDISIDESESTLLLFHDLIKDLTEKQQQIMILRYLKINSDQEIAELLNISRQAVHNQRKKSLKKLKSTIGEV